MFYSGFLGVMIPPVGKEFQGGGPLVKDGLGRGLTFNQTFFWDNRIGLTFVSSDYCDESYLI